MTDNSNCNQRQTANWLNQHCPCQSLAPAKLPEFAQNFFAPTPLFLSRAQLERAEHAISVVQAQIDKPAFQAKILEKAPKIAKHPVTNAGMFMSYDFHLAEDQLNLIEINTNAGGAMLVDKLQQAQDICCWKETPLHWPGFDGFVQNMFETEWTLSGQNRPLKTIAIIDEMPKEQFLYEEFQLTANLLADAGYKVLIADPADLHWDGQSLLVDGERIDLVYNRSTDFYLETPTHQALKQAYMADQIVLSPNPKHHALYASKANLAYLADTNFLEGLNCSAGEQSLLIDLIQAQFVTAANADELWAKRKQYFFKPLDGHAGKAVFRGDKVTKKSWAYIVSTPYIAQRNFKPALRLTKNESDLTPLKSDLRFYTYRGETFAAAARLYAGQTTNFRTNGGGFAPIYITEN
ncbi:hypothetical protein [Maritalea myrionectae]|uniref:hypothetical protein n=1 Tax=Maritalea myrionectae TaxID=454601 RepID=UPI00042306E6|nr:hypothetical protein [Maritalea myrionectae]